MFISLLKALRTMVTFWISDYSIECLKELRIFEAEKALSFLKNRNQGQIVEVGGGAGWQANFFSNAGFSYRSFDVEGSNYVNEEPGTVEIYDGFTLPVPENYADIVFSSNTLEHIKGLDKVLRDHIRILKPNGIALHILPSSSWRIWSIATDVIKKFYWTRPHGEFSSNVWSEILDFSERSWVERFESSGFDVVSVHNGGLFYTANLILGERLSVPTRASLARVLGSSTKYFFIMPKPNKSTAG